MKTLLLAASAAVCLSVSAHATSLLVFSQTAIGDTVIGTVNVSGTSTTIVGTGIPVTIAILGVPTPTEAFLALDANEMGPATKISIGGTTFVMQDFAGSFSITNGSTNYLSGSFTDAVFGSGTSLTLSASDATPGESMSFYSNVIPAHDLLAPRAISLSLADVTPGVRIKGQTLGSFEASIAGDFSASAIAVPAIAVPEPASLALLGTGLLGLGLVWRRLPRMAR